MIIENYCNDYNIKINYNISKTYNINDNGNTIGMYLANNAIIPPK